MRKCASAYVGHRIVKYATRTNGPKNAHYFHKHTVTQGLFYPIRLVRGMEMGEKIGKSSQQQLLGKIVCYMMD